MVGNLKAKVRARQTSRNANEADKLRALRAERVRAEGQVKIINMKHAEQKKLAAAKKTVRTERFQSSTLGRAAVMAKKSIDAAKKNKSAAKGVKREAPSFTKSGSDLFGGSGGSPYALNKPKQVAPKKKKSSEKIVIYIKK